MFTAQEFSARLAELLGREHEALVDFLLALSDFDERRLWIELGYPNLFEFLHRELELSRGAAHYRKVAARLVREYPEIVEALRDGRLCFSSVLEVAKVITPENRAEMLPRFFHRSKREAMDVVAEVKPAAVVPLREVVTALPPTPSAAVAVHPDELADAKLEIPLGAPAPTPRPVEIVPLTAELSRFHVTVSRQLLAKLDQARDALSHSRPNASADEIIEAGLDLLIQRAAKRRGLVEKPRETPPPSFGDGIPAHVTRAVWQRDGGCCTFPLANGGICGSTYQLELDHVRPKAFGPLGRPLAADDFRIRCRPHNVVEGRRKLGNAIMDRYTSVGRVPNAPPPG